MSCPLQQTRQPPSMISDEKHKLFRETTRCNPNEFVAGLNKPGTLDEVHGQTSIGQRTRAG
jgi:hypothetical protein